MTITATPDELTVSIALLGALAAVLSGLAVFLLTETVSWPVDLYIVLGILVLAAVLGAALSVALGNAMGSSELE